jgi:hypothetical protein
MTCSKTVLYWLQEYYSTYANIGHNSLGRLIFLWIIPNGLWILLPLLITFRLGDELSTVLRRDHVAQAEKGARLELENAREVEEEREVEEVASGEVVDEGLRRSPRKRK